MPRLLMRLNPKDELKIKMLKEKYGYTQTSELIRYLVNTKIEELMAERKLKERCSVYPSQ